MKRSLKSVLLACLGLVTLSGMSIESRDRSIARKEAGSSIYIDAVASKSERDQLASLISESNRILKSERFQTNLRLLASIYPSVHANSKWQEISIHRLLSIINLEEPDTRYVATPVTLVGSEAYNDGSGTFNYTARTGSTHFDGESLPGSMIIGRVTMYRYKLDDPVEKSCAINTMVHEQLHTISRSPGKIIFAIEDTTSSERKNVSLPLASYLVGSVAQCTWLQIEGRVKPEGLASCVQVFGESNFNNNRCSQFSNGQDVVPRKGLAAEAPAL